MSTLIQEAEKRQAAAQATLDRLTALIEAESRSFTAEESTQIDEALASIDAEARNIAQAQKIDAATTASEARKAEELRKANAERSRLTDTLKVDVAANTQVEVRDAQVYTPNATETSFLRDLFLAKRNMNPDALDRLHRNNSLRGDMEARAGMTTVAGAGGEFAPPQWMEDEIVALARPGRPFANIIPTKQLPKGVSQFNIPKVATGSQSALQSTQNSGLNIVNPTSSVVSVNINTLASGVLVSQQLIDQSGVPVESYVIPDMAADYARLLDTSLITALAGTSGINTITYTDASPTSSKILAQIQAAIDTVHTTRFAPPTVIVMHPARWGHFLAAVDAQGRPLVVPNPEYGAVNVSGIANGSVSQGVAGTLRGVPVVLDPSIPQNLGTGTNQDEIFVIKADDIWLWEGTPTADVLVETYGAQLSVLYRYWNYYAFTAARYTQATAVISGTGLATTLAYGS